MKIMNYRLKRHPFKTPFLKGEFPMIFKEKHPFIASLIFMIGTGFYDEKSGFKA